MSEQSIAQGATIKRIPYGLADYGIDCISDFAKRDPDQAWFWTQAWQATERGADEDLQNGDYEDSETMDDFIASLNNQVAASSKRFVNFAISGDMKS